MKPQLNSKERLIRDARYCLRCDHDLPNHEPGCPILKERTPKPWKKHNNRSNRITEETNDGE